MAVPTGYDIGLDSTDPADANAVRGFMLVDHRQQDITPSSARRSDGDTRFQLIPSESFWSQQDWAAGYGRVYPHDPAMFWQGPADTAEAGVVRGAWLLQTVTGPASTATVQAVCSHSNGATYFVVNETGTIKLYKLAAGATAAEFETNLTNNVTSMVSYRQKVWIAMGAFVAVKTWDDATLATPTNAPQADVLCPYSSMLFYAWNDATNNTFRINRYDPENTASVADLAILPRNNSAGDYVRSLVALGPDLFVVCLDSLWKFTSQNGNSGVLVGPVDEWVASGEDDLTVSGRAACSFQGAVLYSVGGALRRHQPGGGSRQVWPVSPNLSNPAVAATNPDAAGQSWLIGGMRVYNDRVYLSLSDADTGTTTTHNAYLLCWTGAGMHHLATRTSTVSVASNPERCLIAVDGNGGIVLLGAFSGTVATGSRYATCLVEGSGGRGRVANTTVASSVLDFGQVDLDKVLSRVGILGYVLSEVQDIDVVVKVLEDGATNYTSHTLTRQAALPERADMRRIVYYASATPLVGRNFVIEVTLRNDDLIIGAGPLNPIELYAITAIPNPVYPVRYGFRAVIPVGTHVKLHSGGMAYANQAAVETALDYLRALRASSYPFTLDWIDGDSYTVRCNTISIARDKLRPTESAWVVTLDLQEISG